MPSFSAQPLRRQLLIAILLLLVPVAAAVVWSGIASFRERANDLGEQSRVVAVTISAWVNRDIATVDRIASDLIQVDAVRAFDATPTEDLLQRVLAGRPQLREMRLVDASGRLVVRAATAGTEGDPVGDWSVAALRHGKRSIVPLTGIESPSQQVVFTYPVADHEGRTAGTLGLLIDLRTLQAALAALPLPSGSVVTMSDEDGRVMLQTVDAAKHAGQSPTKEWIAADGATPMERVGPDGVRRMYSASVAEQGPWLVSVGIPMSVALAKATSLWTRSFAILAFGVAGWLIVAYVLSRRLGNSIGHLDAAAQRVAAGDLKPMDPVPMRSRELAELQTAFDTMLQRLRAAREALDAQMAEERGVRRQLESLQGQVIRQERLAAVGQLVSGVAHEINNPLQAILGFAELLQMQSDVPESMKADLALIQKESARACNIIRNLALFARQQPGEAAPVRLADVIASVAELRQRRLESEDIELCVEDRSKQYVLAVLTELQQVVLNFVVNAEQAIVGSGRLPGRITIRTFDAGERAVLEVEDTGPGVPPEHEPKLFQPFFTTKPVGQGTGLGLSVSYGIIDSLSGHAGYRRAPAGGSVFYFDLPAAKVAAE